LDNFKKRHNIVWNRVCEVSKVVDESVVSEDKPKLLELISSYETKNIYNVEETGLLFRALPTKSLMVKGEKYTRGAKCPMKDLQCYCVGIWWKKWKSLSGLKKQQNRDVSRT
jgi:hypothetical protein